MPKFIVRFATQLFEGSAVADAAPLGSPDPATLGALGVSAPVLALIAPSLASFSPDQAHEVGYGLGRG